MGLWVWTEKSIHLGGVGHFLTTYFDASKVCVGGRVCVCLRRTDMDKTKDVKLDVMDKTKDVNRLNQLIGWSWPWLNGTVNPSKTQMS